MIGALLDGRYQVVQELGAGGFGQTFLAQDQKIPGNPTCVVKQLKPLYTSPEQLEFARQLFQREAETLAKLGSHDQIPRLLAYFTEGNEFYLVQDYVEGQPLEAELGTGQRWDERQVMHLLQELLPVLVFVHDQGVIHRDLKPANVIRRRQDNKLVLIDFGAIKQIQGNGGAAGTAVTGTRIGTMGYMSPEQGRGKPQVSSDLYALGMMGIQALTGKLPSQLEEDPDTEEVLWQHLVRVSPGLAQVLTQMVRYSIRDRYKSAVEVLQAIQPLVTSPPSGGIPAAATQSGQSYGATVAATKVSPQAGPDLTVEPPSVTVQLPPQAQLQVKLKSVPQKLRPWVKPFGVMAVIAATIAAIVMGFNSNRLPIAPNWLSEPPLNDVKGTMLTPQETTPVSALVDFKGTVTDRPKSSAIWLVIYAPGIKKYYPYSIPEGSNRNEWEISQIEIGGPRDFNSEFAVYLYLLNKEENIEFSKTVDKSWIQLKNREIRDRGLPNLPSGKLLKSIRVKRKAA
jgi:serine/threonine protein kinase